jgi:hypothetical protein
VAERELLLVLVELAPLERPRRPAPPVEPPAGAPLASGIGDAAAALRVIPSASLDVHGSGRRSSGFFGLAGGEKLGGLGAGGSRRSGGGGG